MIENVKTIWNGSQLQENTEDDFQSETKLIFQSGFRLWSLATLICSESILIWCFSILKHPWNLIRETTWYFYNFLLTLPKVPTQLLPRNYCPAATTPQLLPRNYYTTTTTPQLLHHNYYTTTTTPHLLHHIYYPTTTIPHSWLDKDVEAINSSQNKHSQKYLNKLLVLFSSKMKTIWMGSCASRYLTLFNIFCQQFNDYIIKV